MNPPNITVTSRTSRSAECPGFIEHPSFGAKEARREFDPAELLDSLESYDDHYMPDEVTRDHARRMHYAAYRLRKAKTTSEQNRWRGCYLGLRDRIVLGNRKLIYRAVRRQMSMQNRADDSIGDCHIVLIHAVAAYNPWLGIRFSTYAYTCLIRALGRLAQKHSSDWLSRSMSLEALPDGEPHRTGSVPEPVSWQIPIEEYLREEHPLLDAREKLILSHRFHLRDESGGTTLERVGQSIGLSKERVRQVQASAIDKLRKALIPA